MNIVWLDPAVGTSNQQAMRRGDHYSRGNERAGAEALISHVNPPDGRPGPFLGGHWQSVARVHQCLRLAGSWSGGSRDAGGLQKERSAIIDIESYRNDETEVILT